jgi:nucleotide-binding universal stress UspA family protein
MIQPIVVGTDGSSRADLAVEWAADEATLRHRPLHIVHAAERWDHDMPFYASPGTCESLTETGEHVLAEAVERAAKARPGLPVTSELVFDTPVRALRPQARRADEIVVGHRGLGGFTGMLLGSTGLRLAAQVSVPTIVVRGEARERRHEVLAGVDLSETPEASDRSDAVLRYAFEAAALRDAWVHVVHAWQVPAMLPTVAVCEAEAVTRDRLDDALAPWRARYPDVGVVERTPRAHPVGALTACSSRAALLVVGPGRETRLGSVAHGVIHHADCPVALVGSPD